MERIEKTVFLSYRRTNIPWALAIFQNLTQHGYDLFFDFNGIDSGDFEHVILGNITARAHFLVLLTPSALERCSDPADWLRREIETALSSKRNIVPLMLVKMPSDIAMSAGPHSATQSGHFQILFHIRKRVLVFLFDAKQKFALGVQRPWISLPHIIKLRHSPNLSRGWDAVDSASSLLQSVLIDSLVVDEKSNSFDKSAYSKRKVTLVCLCKRND
jgi:hypothetical protein